MAKNAIIPNVKIFKYRQLHISSAVSWSKFNKLFHKFNDWRLVQATFSLIRYYLQTPLAPLYFGCEHPPPPAEDEDEGGVEVDPLRCCCCCWVCMSRENSWKLMRPSPSKSASSIMDRTSWSVNGSPRLFMVNLENQMNLFWIRLVELDVSLQTL